MRQISNEFNTFFATVAKKLNAKTCSLTTNKNPCDNDFSFYLENRVNNSILLSPTTPDELEEIVKKS